MAKFKFHVSTGYVGSKREQIVEIDDEYLEGLTESERDEVIEEEYKEWLWNNIDSGWVDVD